jgi:hypothetical protein
MIKNLIILLLSLLLLGSGCHYAGKKGMDETATGFRNFITRKGDKLLDGDQEFRFISYNIPNLHYLEDNMAFTETMPYRFPDAYEIRDALLSVRQMGGQVVRTYTLTVRRQDDAADLPRHVTGPGQFNEDAFVALDKILQIANQTGVRVIIPFVDNWHWLGGITQYAEFRNKSQAEFWTDAQLKADFKKTVAFLINRTNTFTGVSYKEDKALLAWETGNELHAPTEWTREMTAYIKTLDKNHLVIDGTQTDVLHEASLEDPNTDFVQTHHYEKDPRDMVAHVKISAEKARGRKPYHLGEFGFISTAGVKAVLRAVIDENVSGALLWSLRYHNRDGGFYWHHEPAGGDLFKAYHWPGFVSGAAYDEINLMQLMQSMAYEIRGLPGPAVTPLEAPELLDIVTPAAISWRGSAGASGYDIERAGSPEGPWQLIGYDVSDARFQYRPLFTDDTVERGARYFYRVRARNGFDRSQPSNVVGPVTVKQLALIDELENKSKTFFLSGDIEFVSDQARKFKEDAHRLRGGAGAAVFYYVPQPIKAWNVYTFAQKDTTNIRFSLSSDSKAFDNVSAEKQLFYSGGGDYGYWIPFTYRHQHNDSGYHYLKIDFVEPGEISRVEIHY